MAGLRGGDRPRDPQDLNRAMPAEAAMALSDPRRLGMYVVTSDTPTGRTHRGIASVAIEGGATAVQLRAPELADDELAPLASSLVAMCSEARVLLLVNDRVDVAVGCRASGAHVGQDDHPFVARAHLGREGILGVSVGGVQEALEAEEAGADYLGVTVWGSSTKPEAVPIGLEGLSGVADATALPVVGIGGIHKGNAREVLTAGAAGIAVISAVASSEDPVGAVRELRALVDDFYEEGPT
jgi:thiamine-phosphate pyrophosphorylase